MDDALRNAVEEWIRAEYQFRFGPSCYTLETQGWILGAERKLRRALTGKGDLAKAFEAIGGKLHTPSRTNVR